MEHDEVDPEDDLGWTGMTQAVKEGYVRVTQPGGAWGVGHEWKITSKAW